MAATTATNNAIQLLISNLCGSAVAAAALIGYSHFNREQPAAPAPPPLATIAKAYRDGQGNSLHAVAEQLRKGEPKMSGGDLTATISKGEQPLLDGIATATKPYIDGGGAITNPSAVADQLDTVAKALGGKW